MDCLQMKFDNEAKAIKIGCRKYPHIMTIYILTCENI